MANDNREGYVKLGYEIDQGSVNAVNQATAAVETRLAALQKSTQGINDVAVKTGSTLKDAFSRSESAIRADQKAVDDLRKSLTEAADEADKLNKSGSGGSKLNVEGLRRTGGALSALGLGDVGGGVSRVGDIAEVGKELKNIGDAAKGLPGLLGNVATQGAALGGSLGAVAAIVGPLAIAVGAIAIAYQKFSADIDEGKKTLEGAVAGVKAYYEAIETGTTESIKRQLDAAKKRQKDEEQELATLQHARAVGFEAAQKQYGDAIARLAFSAGEGRGAFKSVDDRIEELKKNAVTTAGQIGGLERALDSSAVAANDATVAEDNLAKARLQGIEKAIAAEQQTAQLKRSGTSSQVEDRIQALQDEADAINKNLPALEEEAKKSKEAAAELQRYKDRLAEIAKAQKALNDDVLPFIKAKEDEKKAYQDAIKGNEEYRKNQQKYADLAATESSEGLKKRVDSIEREKQAIEDSLPTLDALGESNEEAKQKAIELRKRIDELNQEESKLTTEIKAAVDAREAEAKAIEKQKAQAGIVEKLEDARAEIIQKSEEAQTEIKQRGARERASIEEKYGQKLVEIARNAADEAAKALTELQQKQADLRTSLARDEEKSAREDADKTFDIQIKAQRAERDALQDHVQRLEEIRKSDYAATQKDLLDRNFLSIYQRRLSQNEQIEQENSKFGQDRGKRQQSINDEVQDAQRQAQITRRERLIAFQQQQQDANLAYQRQLVAAKQAHDKELQLAQEAHARDLAENRKKTAQDLADLQAKTTKELAAKQAGAVKELQLLEKTEAQRLDIIAKYAKKANDLIANALKAAPTKRAGGGYLESGQASMVNEPESSGRESFNGVPLPGAGLFIPSQAGYVNPNGGGANNSRSLSATFNIQAQDTEGVKREVLGILRQVMG